MLFLFCVALTFVLWGAACFKVFPCSLSSCFVIPFSIVITSLGEEGASLCASRAFVLYLLVFVIFSLPLFLLVSGGGSGGGGLRFVTVALPGFFLLTFFIFYFSYFLIRPVNSFSKCISLGTLVYSPVSDVICCLEKLFSNMCPKNKRQRK